MTEDLKKAFESLREAHGSHSEAARTLGIGRDHYRAMRNGRVPITTKNERYILSEALKAATVGLIRRSVPPTKGTTTE